jgi:hypothetical protein
LSRTIFQQENQSSTAIPFPAATPTRRAADTLYGLAKILGHANIGSGRAVCKAQASADRKNWRNGKGGFDFAQERPLAREIATAAHDRKARNVIRASTWIINSFDRR